MKRWPKKGKVFLQGLSRQDLSSMRVVRVICAAVLSVLVMFSSGVSASAAEKPFKRSMTMTGGDLDIFIFLGQYDALEDAGRKPDLIVASCGGALAATIIAAFPDRSERMAFIRSPVILGYLQSIKYTDVSIYRLIAELRKATLDNQKQLMPETRRVPTVDLGFSVMSAKNSYRFPELRPSFERRSSKTPEIVFLANRRLYGQADAGKPIHDRSETYPAGHHLYREVLFTSTRVAKLLEGTSSKLGQTMLESFVGPDREIITGKNMGDAVVHSFSDPFYLPANKTWITGAINNLSALDISRLAEENFLGYRKTWSEIDIAVLQENFGFDPSVSDEKFVSATATGWMDMTVDRFESLAQKIKFSPSLHSWPSGFIRLKTNVPRGPNALEKYRQLVDSQYQAGVAQVKSMLSQPLGSKKHIEAPYHKGVKKKPKPRLFG